MNNIYCMPKISVGMPVYNGERTLEAAIECILNQTFGDFEFVISDNASTDRTEEICKKYAKLDSRIIYVRQPFNMGAVKNFNFVLNRSRATYFMWATSDDIKSLNFLQINYDFLKSNPDYVASTCPTRFEGEDFDSKRMGSASLIGDKPARFKSYLNYPHANSRFCSLMRTSIVKESMYLDRDFLGSDWAAMLSIVALGKTHLSNDGFVVLGKAGLSNSGNLYNHYNRRFIHNFLPFYELILAMVSMCKNFPLSCKIYIYVFLLKLNWPAAKSNIRFELKKRFNAIKQGG